MIDVEYKACNSLNLYLRDPSPMIWNFNFLLHLFFSIIGGIIAKRRLTPFQSSKSPIYTKFNSYFP